jgi:signal transduction histidine kinase
MEEPVSAAEIAELRASRARLVAVADTERRRIERALHDGLQQDLIALAVNLQLARERACSADAIAYLDAASRDVHDALDGVRTIAQGIYPSLLVDRGLGEALRGAALTAQVPTRVDATDDRYAPEVEAAVYFACAEALDAVTGTRVTFRVRPDRAAVLFEVEVEGSGESVPDLSRVHDRVGAAGGKLSMSSEQDRLLLAGTVPR